MNPNNSQQYQPIPPSQGPSPGSGGEWDFLHATEPPKPQSFFTRNKKFVIIFGSVFGVLILVAILAAASGGGTKKAGTSANVQGPSTSVATTTYDKEAYLLKYASSLNIALDEKNDDGSGWNLVFAEDKDTSDYQMVIKTSTEAPIYVDGADAVNELLDTDVEPSNVTTSDVVLAGMKAQKTVGDFVGADGRDYKVVYTSTQLGEKYVTVSGTYLKDNTDIADSFDAMIGSIKLK